MVALLATMELPDHPVSVVPVASIGSELNLTDLDLRVLHSRITGLPIGPAPLHRITEEVKNAIAGFPETDAVLYEVQAQFAKVPKGSSEPYRYVPGGVQPERGGDLFAAPAINHTTKAPVRVKRFGVVAAPPVVQVAKTPVKPTATPLPAPKAPHLLPTWHPLYKPA